MAKAPIRRSLLNANPAGRTAYDAARRHCEERSDEAIQQAPADLFLARFQRALDRVAPLAMTGV